MELAIYWHFEQLQTWTERSESGTKIDSDVDGM